MANRNLLIIIFFFVSLSMQSQMEEKRKSLGFFEVLDSMFVDHDLENYSLRLFSNYKVKQFRIVNDDYKLRYIPTNRFGLGFGMANSKVLLDVAFNIKNGKEEATKRFDAQGTLILRKHHYFNGYFQAYNGYKIDNDFGNPTVFRNDIKSWTIGFNYLYTLSEIEFSYSLLRAGLAKTDRNVYFTGGIGTFAMFDYFSSNGSILPNEGDLYFNPQANIKRYSERAIGLLAGFLSAFVLPEDFIVTCNIMPGIALVNKKVTLPDARYRPSDPMLYKVDVNLAVSYNVDRYYVNLSYGTGIYSTKLDFGNKYLFNLSTAKLAVGYKLKI